MNAFEAAEKNDRAGDLQKKLEPANRSVGLLAFTLASFWRGDGQAESRVHGPFV
jgi:hypothetical protein